MLFLLLLVMTVLAGCTGPVAETGPRSTASFSPTATTTQLPPTIEHTAFPGATPLPPTPQITPTTAPSATAVHPTAVATTTQPPADACLPVSPANARPAYRFNVVADPIDHRLRVRQQLALADQVRLATGEIVFNLPAAHAPGVFVLITARLAGQADPVRATLSGTVLRLSLPEPARRAAAVTVCLDYTVDLPKAGGEGISAVHALGWSELGLVAGYWYPVLAPYNPARGWWLAPYHPVGDPLIYDAADYDVTVRAPSGYSVIGPGARLDTDGAWRFALTAGRGAAFIVSATLVPLTGQANGIPIAIYHHPNHAKAAADVLRAAREAMPLFAETYGAYPYDSLTIVEAVQFGGMEYSGLITFSSQSFDEYQPPAAGAAFGADFLIKFVVHEIAHQWWYGAVGNDQAYEPWLDEGLARFSERLYYERLHPANVDWWGSTSVALATVPINRPIYDFADTAPYVQAVYVSAARFLLAVRQALGDQAYYAFLQDYYQQNRGRLVTQAEFLKLLRSQAGSVLDKLLPAYFDPVP